MALPDYANSTQTPLSPGDKINVAIFTPAPF